MKTQLNVGNNEKIQDLYIEKVNALVATGREHLIADITAEYASVLDENTREHQHAAA